MWKKWHVLCSVCLFSNAHCLPNINCVAEWSLIYSAFSIKKMKNIKKTLKMKNIKKHFLKRRGYIDNSIDLHHIQWSFSDVPFYKYHSLHSIHINSISLPNHFKEIKKNCLEIRSRRDNHSKSKKEISHWGFKPFIYLHVTAKDNFVQMYHTKYVLFIICLFGWI